MSLTILNFNVTHLDRLLGTGIGSGLRALRLRFYGIFQRILQQQHGTMLLQAGCWWFTLRRLSIRLLRVFTERLSTSVSLVITLTLLQDCRKVIGPAMIPLEEREDLSFSRNVAGFLEGVLNLKVAERSTVIIRDKLRNEVAVEVSSIPRDEKHYIRQSCDTRYTSPVPRLLYYHRKVLTNLRELKRQNHIRFTVCDACVRPGHVCDPDTGRCVCPRLTYGEHCDRCRPGAWDFVPRIGCRLCACTLGATRSHCDHQGQCPCRIGYDGLRCEKCARGYYGYPRCRPCGCSLAGTMQCQDGVCDCDEKGQCPCKVSKFPRTYSLKWPSGREAREAASSESPFSLCETWFPRNWSLDDSAISVKKARSVLRRTTLEDAPSASALEGVQCASRLVSAGVSADWHAHESFTSTKRAAMW